MSKLTLRKIADIQTGYLFRTKVPEDPNGNVFVVQMKDCSNENGVNWQNCTKTQLASVREKEWLRQGDILLPTRGNHYQPIFIDEKIGDLQAVASPHLFVIRPNSTLVLPKFVAWWLSLRTSQNYLNQNVEGTITKSLRMPVLAEIKIKMPTMRQQQSIVKLVKGIEQERQIAQKLIENNELLLNAIAQNL